MVLTLVFSRAPGAAAPGEPGAARGMPGGLQVPLLGAVSVLLLIIVACLQAQHVAGCVPVVLTGILASSLHQFVQNPDQTWVC